MEGKVALITGASSGIGAGTAEHFASIGVHLALTGRNELNLRETFKKCLQTGLAEENILLITADLSSEAGCKLVIERTIKKYGKLNILVNCAAIYSIGTTLELPVSKFDDVMNVNVRSVFILTQLAIPHLIKTKGNIVNVSSVTGMRAFPGIVAYNMSKAALDQLTRTVALELADKQVRVNAVNPGVVATELQKRGGMTPDVYAKFLERSKTTHALGRVGAPSDVAHAIAFLANDVTASFLTGVTLPVDGGKSIMCPR